MRILYQLRSVPMASLVFALCLFCWQQSERAHTVNVGMQQQRFWCAASLCCTRCVPTAVAAASNTSSMVLTEAATAFHAGICDSWARASAAASSTKDATGCSSTTAARPERCSQLELVSGKLDQGKSPIITAHRRIDSVSTLPMPACLVGNVAMDASKLRAPVNWWFTCRMVPGVTPWRLRSS